MDNKGQSIGMVAGLVGGIAALIIGIIIAFTIVGVLGGSSIVPQTTYTINNESDLTGALIGANNSGYSVNGTLQSGAGSFALSTCFAEYYQSNGSATATTSFGGYNWTLTSTNCSMSSTGNVSNGTAAKYAFPNVSVTYTYIGDNSQNLVVKNLTSNFSTGTQKIASKIPTILLIAAIILIIGVLSVLVGIWQRMRMGGGQI